MSGTNAIIRHRQSSCNISLALVFLVLFQYDSPFNRLDPCASQDDKWEPPLSRVPVKAIPECTCENCPDELTYSRCCKQYPAARSLCEGNVYVTKALITNNHRTWSQLHFGV